MPVWLVRYFLGAEEFGSSFTVFTAPTMTNTTTNPKIGNYKSVLLRGSIRSAKFLGLSGAIETVPKNKQILLREKDMS